MEIKDINSIGMVKSIHMKDYELKIIINGWTKRQEIFGKNFIISDNDFNKIKEHFLSNEFIYQFSKKYSKSLTNEEINEINKFYRSNLMDKLQKIFLKVSIPIFLSMEKYIFEFMSDKEQ